MYLNYTYTVANQHIVFFLSFYKYIWLEVPSFHRSWPYLRQKKFFHSRSVMKISGAVSRAVGRSGFADSVQHCGKLGNGAKRPEGFFADGMQLNAEPNNSEREVYFDGIKEASGAVSRAVGRSVFAG